MAQYALKCSPASKSKGGKVRHSSGGDDAHPERSPFKRIQPKFEVRSRRIQRGRIGTGGFGDDRAALKSGNGGRLRVRNVGIKFQVVQPVALFRAKQRIHAHSVVRQGENDALAVLRDLIR